MENTRKVYLDHNATTPIRPEVQQAIMEAIPNYGNASSMHQPGLTARKAIETSRQQVARLIHCDDEEIIFTGCGSEANNTVINSIQCLFEESCHPGDCSCRFGNRNHIITSAVEHPSILQTCECYEKRGYHITYLPVDKGGRVHPDTLREAIRPDTGLITIMTANNEIGTIQPIKELVQIAHENQIPFHSDGVQAAGKIPVDVNDLGVDFMSISGHKLNAPKGVGVLYVRKGKNVCPLIYGGHHEHNRRAGTENNIGIIAMGKAAELAGRELDDHNRHLTELRDRLRDGLREQIPDTVINGDTDYCLPNTLNMSFRYVEGESILLYADLAGIALSTGSACSTGSLDPSHVITALGADPETAHSSIRFSLGYGSNAADIDYVLEVFPGIIERLRKMSPLTPQKGAT